MRKRIVLILVTLIIIAAAIVLIVNRDSIFGNEVKINPTAEIIMENGKTIKIELYPDIAPNTVANFISLAESGFYDGLIFHKVRPNFWIQGGDPEGTGFGGPNYTIKGEFSANGFKNSLPHIRGTVSMARNEGYDSAGSQFFILVYESPTLDGNYASFGTVIEGLDAVDEIASVYRDKEDKPIKDQKIKSIEIENVEDIIPPETMSKQEE